MYVCMYVCVCTNNICQLFAITNLENAVQTLTFYGFVNVTQRLLTVLSLETSQYGFFTKNNVSSFDWPFYWQPRVTSFISSASCEGTRRTGKKALQMGNVLARVEMSCDLFHTNCNCMTHKRGKLFLNQFILIFLLLCFDILRYHPG